MGGGSFQPDFKGVVAHQNETGKAKLDPKPKAEQVEAEQTLNDEVNDGTEVTISMYQDPRDALDFERHQMGGIGGRQVRD